MLLNASAGSAASALKELAFETALAAKHLKVRVLRARARVRVRVRLRLNRAPCSGASWSATGSTASSAPKLPASNPRILPMMRTCKLPCSTRQKAWPRRCTSPCTSLAATSPSFRGFTKNTMKLSHARCERAAATCRSICWSSSCCRTTARRCWRGCEQEGLPRRSRASHRPPRGSHHHRPDCSLAVRPPPQAVSEATAVPCCKQRALETSLSWRPSAAAALRL
jgi:hypothetical protein